MPTFTISVVRLTAGRPQEMMVVVAALRRLDLLVLARRSAGRPSIGHPLPGPLKEYSNPTPETDQEENMGKCPHQPADKTGDLDEAEIHCRRRTTNDRQRTRIAVAEGWRREGLRSA